MRWMYESWHQLLPHPWGPVLLVPAAALCGALVGIERELREKPAGVRTMAMVCLGAALFTLIGYSFSASNGDSGRVAAQIVSGIGFLGGGIILRTGASVHGITTAATIWAVAAMGMVVGAGYPAGGLGVALLILIVLWFVGRIEARLLGGSVEECVEIVFEPEGGKTAVRLALLLEDFGNALIRRETATLDDGRERWELCFRMSARHRRDLLQSLASIREVRTIARHLGR